MPNHMSYNVIAPPRCALHSLQRHSMLTYGWPAGYLGPADGKDNAFTIEELAMERSFCLLIGLPLPLPSHAASMRPMASRGSHDGWVSIACKYWLVGIYFDGYLMRDFISFVSCSPGPAAVTICSHASPHHSAGLVSVLTRSIFLGWEIGYVGPRYEGDRIDKADSVQLI
jgi:hypothetical protein